MSEIDCKTITAGEYPVSLKVREHRFSSDMSVTGGGTDSSPGPHDYFDAALASCKALTVVWYAKRHQIPLERVDAHVESDAAQERAGVYKLKVQLIFHGEALTDEQRALLHRAAAACPIHKLMATSDVQIETVE
jgi:putative redox protein